MARTSNRCSGKGTPYSQDGIFKKGQRLIHPKFGWGTVVKVRHRKVVLLMDADIHVDDDATSRGAKCRIFIAAKLDLEARRRANGLKDYSAPRVIRDPKKKADGNPRSRMNLSGENKE